MDTKELQEYFDWVDAQCLPEDFDTHEDRISFWKYEMFNQCPLKFKRIVLDKDPIPQDSRNAFEGLVLHAVMDEYIKNTQLPPIGDLVADVFQKTIAEAKLITWKTTPPDLDMTKAYRTVEKMVDWSVAYLDKTQILSYTTPYTEFPFKSRVLPGLMVSGRVDLWTEDPDNEIKVYDWKTVKDASSPKKNQMLFYVLGLFSETRKFAHKGHFVCPKVEKVLDLDFSVEEVLEFVEELRTMHIEMKRMKAVMEYPKKHSYMCRFCVYDKECNVPLKQGATVNWSRKGA